MSELIIVAPSSPVVVTPTSPIVVRPSASVPVQRVPRGAWDERNWSRERHGEDTIYEGDFVVRDARGAVRRFPGRVEVRGADVQVYVADPPLGLRRHPKGACFQRIDGGPWHRCNWYVPARTQDDAILYVEQVLAEAVRR